MSTILSPHSIPFSDPVKPDNGYHTYGLGTYLHSYRNHQALSHAGGVPGQYTYQLVLPKVGKAIFVFSNEDLYSAYINKVVAYTVMDVLLGMNLDENTWETQIMDDALPDRPPTTNSRSGSRDTDEEEDMDRTTLERDIVATFTHPAYPTLIITPLPSDSPVIKYFPTMQKHSPSVGDLRNRQVYIANPESVFVNTILFIHHSGQIWHWMATKLYPAIKNEWEGEHGGDDGGGGGGMVMPFIDGCGNCLVCEKGLGMSGDWWNSSGKRRRDANHKLVDGVEVWYTRQV